MGICRRVDCEPLPFEITRMIRLGENNACLARAMLERSTGIGAIFHQAVGGLQALVLEGMRSRA